MIKDGRWSCGEHDLENVVAIDIHTHAEVGRTGEDGLRPEWRDAAKKYFGEGGTPTAEDVAAYYRERNMAAVVFTVDAETSHRTPPSATRRSPRSRPRTPMS